MCNNITKPDGVNQNIKLFKRGKATSRIPNCVGNKKLPNAPNIRGITIKKTITIPCKDTTVRYFSALLKKTDFPGQANSMRINVASIKPEKPDITVKTKYITAILLWLVERTQLSKKEVTLSRKILYFKFRQRKTLVTNFTDLNTGIKL